MTKPSPPIPKRDFLSSQRPDRITRALDESYERGYALGRAAGLERACQLLRDARYTAEIAELLQLLTSEKYR